MEKNLFVITNLKDCESWIIHDFQNATLPQEWIFDFTVPRLNMKREFWISVIHDIKNTPDNLRWHLLRQMMPFFAVCHDIRTGFSWQQMLWSTFLNGMRPASSDGYKEFVSYLHQHHIEVPKGIDLTPLRPVKQLTSKKIQPPVLTDQVIDSQPTLKTEKKLEEIYQKNA